MYFYDCCDLSFTRSMMLEILDIETISECSNETPDPFIYFASRSHTMEYFEREHYIHCHDSISKSKCCISPISVTELKYGIGIEFFSFGFLDTHELDCMCDRVSEELVDIIFFTTSLGISVNFEYESQTTWIDIISCFPYFCIPEGIYFSCICIFTQPLQESFFFFSDSME
jgi:hypothetical protein